MKPRKAIKLFDGRAKAMIFMFRVKPDQIG
jgi:hypothetical protein